VKLNSIRFKISVFFTVILGIILIIYTAILYFGQRYALYRDLDRDLTIKAQAVANAVNAFFPVLENDRRAFYLAANRVIRQDGMIPGPEKASDAQKQWLATSEKLGLGRDYVVMASAEGEAIANSANVDGKLLAYFLKSVSLSQQKTVAYRDVDLETYRLRLIAIPYYYKGKRMYVIQVGSSRIPIIKSLYGRMLFASFTIPFVLLLSVVLVGMITDRILEPLMKVTDTVKNITYKDLSARVQIEHVDEELRYLVDAFNEMISRLEQSFRYIAEFSSNVAHELKTPLTILRGESELALMQVRDSREYQRVIKVNLEEIEKMLKIVEDLLLLSKLEYQPGAFNFERLDFNAFMREVFEQAKKIAAQKNITVNFSGAGKQLFLQADGLHLRRMFLNLLNNAVKFTSPGGSIGITVRAEAKRVEVSVSDTGVGIKPEHIDKVFDRFFHVDHKHLTSESGSGLGLSIAQSIARIHRGDISAKSQPYKGAAFTVTLPL
jgi:two-component system, OmpR family, heavy metal sensor histidine kinase CusS